MTGAPTTFRAYSTWAVTLAVMSLCHLLSGIGWCQPANVTKSQDFMEPQWIWSPEHAPGEVPQEACYFRKAINLPEIKQSTLRIAADDVYQVHVNGKKIGTGNGATSLTEYDITSYLKTGKNVIAVKVDNRNGQTAGLAAKISVEPVEGHGRLYLTNPTWRTSLRVLPLWDAISYRDSRWKGARNLGPFGSTTPWLVSSKAKQSPAQPSEEQVTSDTDLSTNPTSNDPASDLEAYLAASDADAAEAEAAAATPPDSPPSDTAVSSSPAAKSTASKSQAAKSQAAKSQPANSKAIAAQGSRSPAKSTDGAEPQKTTSPAMEEIVEDHPEFSVRPGFQIQHVVGNGQTGSLLAMTFNEFGQILTSQEGGPLLMVYDSNDNGTPDKVRVYCRRVVNCQGILPISGRVYVIGDGPSGAGLYQLEDRNRDGELEFATAIVKFKEKLAEHGPHGLALGPDGMIYISLGNHARLNQPYALTSPHLHYYEGELTPSRYEDPQGDAAGIKAPGGGVLRVDLSGQKAELFAGGLRNAYDLAFNEDGDLFLHDSDMESDMGTPWHRPTRLHHVAAGGEFGWRSGAAKWPDYLIDALPAVMETGRGSPTGGVFYDHWAYPAKYRNTFFSCDWSQGEIHSFRLDKRGASYAVHRELFLQGKPLNVTDIDVGPDGWLYFCTGGRGTRGNIFRIACDKEVPASRRASGTGVVKAIKHPQLQSAWGRQAVSSLRQELGDQWDSEIRQFVTDKSNPPEQRARGLQIMHLIGPPPSDVELLKLSLDPSPIVRSRTAYLMGLIGNDVAAARLTEMLRDETAVVRRQACDALARSQQEVTLAELVGLLASPDRFEAWAARRLLERNEKEDWQEMVLHSDNPRVFAQAAAATMIATPNRARALEIIRRFEEFTSNFVSDADFVEMLRVLQLCMERGGIQPADVPDLAQRLTQEFPAGNIRINRELVRLLVYLQAGQAVEPLLAYLESEVADEEKIHTAIHLRFLDHGWNEDQKIRLLSYLEFKSSDESRKNLNGYLDAVTKDVVATLQPSEQKTLLEHGHRLPKAALAALFELPESDDMENFETLRQLDVAIADLRGRAFDNLRVGIVAVLARGGGEPPMAYLREVYDQQPERRQVIAMGLAQQPGGRNWDYLVRSIPLLEGEPAREVLSKLKEVNYAPELPEHQRQVILCGLRLKENGGLQAAELLTHWVGSSPKSVANDWKSKLEAWQRWYQETYPNQPVAAPPVESDTNRWSFDDLVTFMASPEGSQGSIPAGELVFDKAKCATCHAHGTKGGSYGPDLTTLRNRFQLREIIEAIVYPSQVISDQYRSQTIVTNDGQKTSGLLIGTDTTGKVTIVPPDGVPVAFSADSVDEILPHNASSMPEGLLNDLTLAEIADLFAFLLNSSTDLASQPSDIAR